MKGIGLHLGQRGGEGSFSSRPREGAERGSRSRRMGRMWELLGRVAGRERGRRGFNLIEGRRDKADQRGGAERGTAGRSREKESGWESGEGTELHLHDAEGEASGLRVDRGTEDVSTARHPFAPSLYVASSLRASPVSFFSCPKRRRAAHHNQAFPWRSEGTGAQRPSQANSSALLPTPGNPSLRFPSLTKFVLLPLRNLLTPEASRKRRAAVWGRGTGTCRRLPTACAPRL